jgi:glycosyltransferase involved in cell wall biosynthesis
MKIEFIYGTFSCGAKLFDFDNLYDDPKGLTGSEHSCFEFAKCMAARGHDITLFTYTKNNQSFNWHGVQVKPIVSLSMARIPPDVVYSWNEPDYLRFAWEGSLRMVNQQLNDFDFCQSGYDRFVDVYTSPSPSHKEYIKDFTPSPNKWEVISNCANPELFDNDAVKKPFSVIYCSSPDRGLHLLLQEWPKIKQLVPKANLKIFYDFDRWYNNLGNVSEHDNIHRREFKNRADYIKYALDAMKDGFDITHHKVVSKRQICQEISEAMVLAYPCSTVKSTEGFSVSIMENCLTSIPVISEEDSLQQIYGAVVPMIKKPATKHMGKFVELVVKALTDTKFQQEIRPKLREFALEFDYRKEAIKLENLMQDKCKELGKGQYADK